MGKRSTNESDIVLSRKVFMWLQWGQAAVGIFLLYTVVNPSFHAIFAAVTLAALSLGKWGWEKLVGRVFARLFSGLPWLFAALLLAVNVLSLSLTKTTVSVFYAMCLIGGPLLTYQGLAAGMVSLHGGRYDRFVACFTYTWLLFISLLTVFSNIEEDIHLTVDSPVLQLVWVGLAIATTLLSWLCLLLRTPEQKAAAKAKKEAKTISRT